MILKIEFIYTCQEEFSCILCQFFLIFLTLSSFRFLFSIYYFVLWFHSFVTVVLDLPTAFFLIRWAHSVWKSLRYNLCLSIFCNMLSIPSQDSLSVCLFRPQGYFPYAICLLYLFTFLEVFHFHTNDRQGFFFFSCSFYFCTFVSIVFILSFLYFEMPQGSTLSHPSLYLDYLI